MERTRLSARLAGLSSGSEEVRSWERALFQSDGRLSHGAITYVIEFLRIR